MSDVVAVVLAAGKGTRMQSPLPKVLHAVCGRPMIDFVLDAARAAGAERFIVVVGHGAETVKDALKNQSDVEFALQAEQNGTGHAVMMCADQLAGHDGPVLILAGDTPLLTSKSLTALLDELHTKEASCIIGTAITEQNEGLGRIVRDANGEFQKIVEQKDATPEEAAIQEINTGCFAFECRDLIAALRELRPNNQQAEYYLTDCPAILKSQGKQVSASPQLTIDEAMGVNTPDQLADVEDVLNQRAAAANA